jgi:hypothetical protein
VRTYRALNSKLRGTGCGLCLAGSVRVSRCMGAAELILPCACCRSSFQYGDVSTGLTAENPTINTNTSIARGIGTHFNPAGVPHACFPNATRHVGDIVSRRE